MSYHLIPDAMLAYATEELVNLLAALTPQQRGAIHRIVEHVYIRNLPLAHLLRPPDPIVSERRYYDKGEQNPATGDWIKRPGWKYDPAFQAALSEAARLALSVRTREEVAAWQNAKRSARLATPMVVAGLVEISTAMALRPNEAGELAPETRATEDKDRINASKILLDYARPDPAELENESDGEADWWAAAELAEGEK